MNTQMREWVESRERKASQAESPRQSWTHHGVEELFFGCWLLASDLSRWLMDGWPQNSMWHHRYREDAFSVAMLMVAMCVIHQFKKRVMDSRTPFAESEGNVEASRASMVKSIATGLLIASVSILALAKLKTNFSVSAAAYGLLMATLHAWMFARTLRWKRFVAVALSLGTILIAAFFPGTSRFAPEAFVSITLLLSGGVSLWLYLRNTKPLPLSEPNPESSCSQ